jgi:hypothetical protein
VNLHHSERRMQRLANPGLGRVWIGLVLKDRFVLRSERTNLHITKQFYRNLTILR